MLVNRIPMPVYLSRTIIVPESRIGSLIPRNFGKKAVYSSIWCQYSMINMKNIVNENEKDGNSNTGFFFCNHEI